MNVIDLIDDGTYIYAGTYQGSIYRRILSEVAGVVNISNEIPGSYRLSQNYPNPFNPVTNIQFSVPRAANVKINVYDSQGKAVAKLLDQRMSAGSYKVDFDGADLSSGVYYYRLESENFTESKSMMLLK